MTNLLNEVRMKKSDELHKEFFKVNEMLDNKEITLSEFKTLLNEISIQQNLLHEIFMRYLDSEVGDIK